MGVEATRSFSFLSPTNSSQTFTSSINQESFDSFSFPSFLIQEKTKEASFGVTSTVCRSLYTDLIGFNWVFALVVFTFRL